MFLVNKWYCSSWRLRRVLPMQRRLRDFLDKFLQHIPWGILWNSSYMLLGKGIIAELWSQTSPETIYLEGLPIAMFFYLCSAEQHDQVRLIKSVNAQARLQNVHKMHSFEQQIIFQGPGRWPIQETRSRKPYMSCIDALQSSARLKPVHVWCYQGTSMCYHT